MSLKPMAIPPVPAETARVAKAAFPKGNIYMKLSERGGTLFRDDDFAALFSNEGASGLPPLAVGAHHHPPYPSGERV
jgi:transposase